MNILKKLSTKSLLLNKKRTIGTIIGIILSTALICATSGMLTCFQSTLIENAINETGYYHLSLYNANENDIKSLKTNRKIKDIKTIYDLGYSIINEKDKDDPYIHIYSTDFIDELSFKIINGRKPTNENEIILSKKVEKDLNLKIGDTINLNIGKRVTNDNYTLDDTNPYNEDLEKLVDIKPHTYKIVGFFKKPGYNYSNFGITTKDYDKEIITLISLKNPKNYKKEIPIILGQKDYNETLYRDLEKSKFNYELNNELLRWEAFAFSDSTVTMLTTVITVVIVIIMISSIFCIRNSFAISTSEKTKMYGMLASIGATKKQIKKSVIYEGIILSLIAIPIGIMCGVFAVFILIKLTNYIMDGLLFENIDGLIFNISLIGILLSIILGYLTVYLSCIASAKKASKVSPIVNITNSERITIKPNKLKTPKIITKLFKVGGSLSYKNLKRSKKKYRTTLISLTISIFVFISMNYFLTESFNLSNKYYTSYNYNLDVSGITKLTENDISSIRKNSDVKKLYVIYEILEPENMYIKIFDKSKLNYDEIYFPLDQECEYDKKLQESICKDEYYRALQVIALDDLTFKEYIKKLKLDYDEVKDKGVLSDTYKYYLNNIEKTSRSYKYNKGDKITWKEKNITFKIGAITNINPYGYENRYYGGGYLIVNKEYFKSLPFIPYHMAIDAKETEEITKVLENLSSDLRINNYEEIAKEDKSMRLVISIFLYGFITVITLIGVTTIFNTINSNMELRSKEFAMLKSIGMTKSEFKHMINLETLFVSFKSLIYGIILGLIGSFIIHWAFNKKEESPYILPIIPVILSVIFVFLLVYIIMKFSINKINKQNTIETIRNDNI